MKKRITIALTIFAAILVIIFFDYINNFIITIQWFREVNYLPIYFTKLVAILKLMVPLFVVFYTGIWLYYRGMRKSIIKVRKIIEITTKKRKREKVIFISLNTIISFILSYSFSSAYWYRILEFTNSTSFNDVDPIFNKDISFYIFKLPLIQSLYNILFSILVILLLVTFVLFFVMVGKDQLYNIHNTGTFDFKIIRSGITEFAGKQLAVVSSLMLIMLAIGHMLKSYYLVYSSRGAVFGAGYTDINISLLFYRIIIAVCLVSAVVVFVSITRSKFKPIVISVLSILGLVILEGVAIYISESFIVKSNQISLEDKYIKYNIEYTRKAFDINNIDEKTYNIVNNLTREDLNNNRDTLDNIKVNSFRPALDFYNQVQVIRYYYEFNDIDVDRYNINNRYSQVFVAPREINSDTIEPNTWQNKHLRYTHGYGVVMSKVNSVTPEGQPNFVIKDIPPENSTDIDIKNPRIYFGEKTNYYAVVNTGIDEFDYPKGGDNQVNKYDGKAGLRMTFTNRILFAIKERNINFLTSKDINNKSRILLHRNILERVNKIAPFIKYDKDPYIVVANGKLYWVIDGYTITDKYPYAQPYEDINYIRNSVKVIVDAFDGTTDFYIIDKNDPIINSYSKIFTGLFKEADKIPQEIKSHFRYPEDLFNTQCTVLGKYHMTDTKEFLTGGDLWEVAQNEKEAEGDPVPNEASYMVMKLPGEKSEEMVLLEYFNVRDRENMTAMLAARMDGENYGKLVLYKLPSNRSFYGPYQFKKKIKQDTEISKDISLWQGKGSSVDYGDTIILPINNSLLYIEPMYLKAEGKNSIPEMKRVIVGYGERIVSAETIDKALEKIFTEIEGQPNAPANPLTNNGDNDWAQNAKDLYNKALEAQKSGDWAKYGEYIKELGELLNTISK